MWLVPMSMIRELCAMKIDQTPTYDAWPFYWLTRAHGRYQDALSSALADTGLDPTSWRILMILKEQDRMAVSDIAQQANTKLSTMTKAVQRMEASGLVSLQPSERDRRVTEVMLTQTGADSVPIAEQTAQHVFNRAFAGFDPDRLRLLSDLLGDLAENLR